MGVKRWAWAWASANWAPIIYEFSSQIWDSNCPAASLSVFLRRGLSTPATQIAIPRRRRTSLRLRRGRRLCPIKVKVLIFFSVSQINYNLYSLLVRRTLLLLFSFFFSVLQYCFLFFLLLFSSLLNIYSALPLLFAAAGAAPSFFFSSQFSSAPHLLPLLRVLLVAANNGVSVDFCLINYAWN